MCGTSKGRLVYVEAQGVTQIDYVLSGRSRADSSYSWNHENDVGVRL